MSFTSTSRRALLTGNPGVFVSPTFTIRRTLQAGHLARTSPAASATLASKDRHLVALAVP